MPTDDGRPTGASEGTERLNVYVPIKARPYWSTIGPAVDAAVLKASDATGRDPRSLYPPATAFALWAWQSRGIDATVHRVFRRRLVEEFVQLGMPTFSRTSRATYRSALISIVDAITPGYEKARPFPRSEPTAPYTTAEIASLRSWAVRQGRASRRQDALTLLALGLGAGLATREILSVRVTDLDWDGESLVVAVWNGRPRTVPVQSYWVEPLVRLVNNGDLDRWAFRPGRLGVRGAQVTDFLHRGQQTELDVRPARMRTTWILSHLATGTPPAKLLEICGAGEPSRARPRGRVLARLVGEVDDRAVMFGSPRHRKRE